jgi:hypothetical protein
VTKPSRVVWNLPVLAQEFMEGPRVTFADARLVLEYDYEAESGEYKWSRIEFAGVRAVSFTAYVSCDEEQVKAYGKLIELADSGWLERLRRTHFAATDNDQLHHYRIFLDEVGCYEVAATGFQAEPLSVPPMTPPATD